MGSHAVDVLTSNDIAEAANRCVTVLRHFNKEQPCPSLSLQESLGLTKGQLSRLIKYMRRSCESDLQRFIAYYPISSKKGYFLPSKWEDFAPCFVTLAKWVSSLHRTIEPMRKKMEEAGIDYEEITGINDEYRDSINEFYDSIDEMNKDTSWFLDD